MGGAAFETTSHLSQVGDTIAHGQQVPDAQEALATLDSALDLLERLEAAA